MDWLIVSFWLVALGLLALDLGLFSRRYVPSTKEALAWSGFWVVLALVFTAVIHYGYAAPWLGLGLDLGEPLGGPQAALKFLTGFLLEKTIALDNVLLIALVFTYYRIPFTAQYRVLFWGVIGALIFRVVLIAGGLALLDTLEWGMYILAALVFATAGRLLVVRHDNLRPERQPLVALLRRRYAASSDPSDERLFAKVDGGRAVTPAGLALAYVIGIDALLAADAVPAILVVTRDPFLVVTANIFALLGLRALYFALAALLENIRYFKVSLVFILFYLGVKAMLFHTYTIPAGVSLAVIGALLTIGVLISTVAGRRDPRPLVSPVADQIGELALLTWGQARRVVILVVGSTVLLIGAAMIVLPGPAVVVIPVGLAILSTEFFWARQLLRRVKRQARRMQRAVRKRR